MTHKVLLIALLLAVAGCKKAKPTAADPGPPPGHASPGPLPAGAASAELAALKGTWRVVSITAAGQKIPDDRVQKLQLDWVFDENGLAIRRPDRPAEPPGRLTFDPTTNPKRYTKMSDIAPTRAVYQLDGKTLTVCLMVDENQGLGFPVGLVSTASPKTDLLVLERR